ncbi:MAG: prepilin-type N-terminal cleavage/methylation domain-containing protein [Planctomycetota bacterium]|jgi:prepilin-type N-terminal cleavage/methylation domain-containing protein
MRTPTNHRESGFTLIEILIVTTVFGVLAGVAVPNLLSSRLAANEAAVIATMRAISTAQFQFQSSGELDVNRDAGFEFGTFGELSAVDELRGTGTKVTRNLLSTGSAKVDAAGWATHHGFHFCLYLPDASGVGLPGMPANSGAIDPRLAHGFWTCLAWPVEVGTTGRRAFFVNQQGQVLQSMNTTYSGSALVPAAGAGLIGVAENNINTQRLAVDTFGSDGQHWLAVH